MKKFLKNNLKLFVGIFIGIVLSIGTSYAATILFNADEVHYDNSTSGMKSTDVQAALDELYAKRPTGTAGAGQVLTGYTFSNNTESGINGSMPNRGAWSKSVSSTTAQTGAAGYYSSVSCAKAANSGTFTTSTNSTAVDMGANQNYRYVNTTGVYNAGKSAASASRVKVWSGSTLGNVSVNLSGYSWVYIKVTGGSTLLLQVNGAAGWVANDTTSPDGMWGSWVGARQFKATSSGITALSGTRCGTENHWGNVWLYITEVWGIKNLS